MSLLYRGVWQDDRPDLCDALFEAFEEWVATKRIDCRVPDEGHVSGESAEGPCEVVVRRAVSGGCHAVQIELEEDRGAEQWTTRLTGIEVPEGGHWVWVDLERVADASAQRPLWAAPRLVRTLIDSGVDVRVDHVRLSTETGPLAPRPLRGLITHPDRSLPLIVFSEGAGGYTPALKRARRAAERLAGAVQVFILRASDIDEFKEVMPGGLGVWGGAARLYLPNSGPGGLRPERHRYLSPEQMGTDDGRPGRSFAAMLTGTVTSRRPPGAYDLVRRELRLGRNRSDAELLAFAEAEMTRLTREHNELKDLLQTAEEELLDTQIDLDEVVIEKARLANALQLMLVSRDEPEHEHEVADLAVEAQCISEALKFARERLSGVVIPEGIERDLDSLDGHNNSRAWGGLAWSGLRALHLYASGHHDGNFKDWCANSGHQWAWSANDKKLAMRESESVESNERLRKQRVLPVATEVDPSGRTLMWAHLKIAEGGGPLAPRVYFHDDTRGSTGKVHVGFVGPHRYMENTKTN